MIYGYINKNVMVNQLNPDQLNQCDEIYIEEEVMINHAEDQLLDQVKPRDVIITSSLTNFGFTLSSALRTIMPAINNDVRIIAYNEEFDSDVLGDALKVLYPVIVSFDRTHRRSVLEKNKAKINNNVSFTDLRKANRITHQSFEDFNEKYEMYKSGALQKKAIAKDWNISRPTLDRIFKDYEDEVNH